MYVYILTNKLHTVLYIGVTKDLVRRMYEHRQEIDRESFTARYHVHALVYFEETSSSRAAIEREKQLKSWNRKRKNQLIESVNPTWNDLYAALIEQT